MDVKNPALNAGAVFRRLIGRRHPRASARTGRLTRPIIGIVVAAVAVALLVVHGNGPAQRPARGASPGGITTSAARLEHASLALSVRRLLTQELHAEETGNVGQALDVLTPHSPMRLLEAATIARFAATNGPTAHASLVVGPVAVVSVHATSAVVRVREVLGDYQVRSLLGTPAHWVHRHLVLVSLLELHKSSSTWRLFRRSYLYAKDRHLTCKGVEQCALALTGA